MPIISKETWDKIPEAERYLIKKHFDDLYEEKQECEDKEDVIFYNGGRAVMRELFGKEQLQPKPLAYEDVARELFGKDGGITPFGNVNICNEFTCTSKKQAEKLLAINKLLNVAKFLNGDWKPNWDYVQDKWYLAVEKGKVKVDYHDDGHNSHIVYFRTQQLAKQAVQILGEEVIQLALTTEY